MSSRRNQISLYLDRYRNGRNRRSLETLSYFLKKINTFKSLRRIAAGAIRAPNAPGVRTLSGSPALLNNRNNHGQRRLLIFKTANYGKRPLKLFN